MISKVTSGGVQSGLNKISNVTSGVQSGLNKATAMFQLPSKAQLLLKDKFLEAKSALKEAKSNLATERFESFKGKAVAMASKSDINRTSKPSFLQKFAEAATIKYKSPSEQAAYWERNRIELEERRKRRDAIMEKHRLRMSIIRRNQAGIKKDADRLRRENPDLTETELIEKLKSGELEWEFEEDYSDFPPFPE